MYEKPKRQRANLELTHTKQTYITVYLTAEAAYTSLSYNTEQLWLSGMLVTQEADSRFIVNAHKAWVRCR